METRGARADRRCRSQVSLGGWPWKHGSDEYEVHESHRSAWAAGHGNCTPRLRLGSIIVSQVSLGGWPWKQLET